MKILLEIRHPAHFHHFKNMIWKLQEHNHDVKVIVSTKDIVIDLINSAGMKYEIIGHNQSGLFSKVKELIKQDIKVMKVCNKYKPDLVIGRPSQTVTLSSFLLKINSVIFAEDDFKAVWLGALVAYPFAKVVLAPFVTDLGIFSFKKLGYNGYQKIAYLHPNWFVPNKRKIDKYININKPYFILRFAKLGAHHDRAKSGITNEIAQELVNLLIKHGNIYITTERRLEAQFEKYKIQVKPQDIHHALFYAKIFIGDSQTMATEAGILGTPFIRFNDFVGKLGILNELENEYKLGFGFKTNQYKEMISKVKELLKYPSLKQEWQKRRRKMLSEKIDVTEFMVWFIENYPKSERIMKENPNYQYNFK